MNSKLISFKHIRSFSIKDQWMKHTWPFEITTLHEIFSRVIWLNVLLIMCNYTKMYWKSAKLFT